MARAWRGLSPIATTPKTETGILNRDFGEKGCLFLLQNAVELQKMHPKMQFKRKKMHFLKNPPPEDREKASQNAIFKTEDAFYR